jgi:hypothetical protein
MRQLTTPVGVSFALEPSMRELLSTPVTALNAVSGLVSDSFAALCDVLSRATAAGPVPPAMLYGRASRVARPTSVRPRLSTRARADTFDPSDPSDPEDGTVSAGARRASEETDAERAA